MPPVRTSTSRSGKAERTHEENVERAFIAASRRCDRTLEARVESARRASEIHKARTGRGLKITEKDVQNEEMYEEEDDLPLPYRHLTAGFQTSSPEFNRRFAAYLTTHVAIRTALEQSIIQSYAQQQEQQAGFAGQPQFLNQQYGMFPSPILAHQAQQSQQMNPPIQPTPINRYSPYSVPTSLKTAQLSHQVRSIPSPLGSVKNEAINSIGHSENLQSPALSPIAPNKMPNGACSASSPIQASFVASGAQASMPLQSDGLQNQLLPQNFIDISSFCGPMSTTLPAETQSLLGTSYGFNDPTYNVADTAIKPNPYGDIENTQFPSGERLDSDTGQRSSGLNSTLLPEALVQERPSLSPNMIYLDDPLQSISVGGTPSVGEEVDENDWRYFLNRNEPWIFSD